jgi:hypothetical protein
VVLFGEVVFGFLQCSLQPIPLRGLAGLFCGFAFKEFFCITIAGGKVNETLAGLSNEDDLLLAIAFNNIEPALLTQFLTQIAKPSYGGKINYALNDLFEKARLHREKTCAQIVEPQQFAGFTR